jgi:hypothetical protein
MQHLTTIRRCMVVVAIAATAGVIATSTGAAAENPLYCNGEYTLNNGCGEGPRGLLHVNEARNQNGGCIAAQNWAAGGGFSPVSEECGGGVAGEVTTKEVEGYPRCWNRTNAKNLIHCRYELYKT